jgi:hypothetical protein
MPVKRANRTCPVIRLIGSLRQASRNWRILVSMISSKALLLVPILCVTLACILVEGCGDKRDLFYGSLADAAKAGEIDRGWIPDYLPKTSRVIHLTEQDSPSKEWCGFEFLPTDSQSLRENLKGVDALPPSVRRVPSPGVSWWPAMLNGEIDAQKIHRERFELYVIESPADSVSTWVDLFAINWSEGRGFFYGTRE